MTGRPLPAHDLLLPPASRDAHVIAGEAMLRRLATAFPTAGLGITGSVATGTHAAGSDVDLVVVDVSFRREMQFATISEGIRTAVLCLRPEFDAEREFRWTLAAGDDVRIVSMVRSAFVARDPAGHLKAMQRTVARLDQARRIRRDELVSMRREHALAAVHALCGGSGATDEHLQLELFAAVVDGWFLQQRLAMDTRQESERMLETIAGRDVQLFALLRQAVPLTHASMAPLLRAMDHVFASAPGDGDSRGQG